jgi:putative phosphoribosyl transferase
MNTQFNNRSEAGRQLAQKLGKYARRSDVLVLGIPRSGIPVAFEIAGALDAPLDVFCVSKLFTPGHEDSPIGAVAPGGVRVLNDDIIKSLRLTDQAIERLAALEIDQLEHREQTYRGNNPPAEIAGKTVILVDDGVTTGISMAAGIAALKKLNASRIVIATPVVSLNLYEQISRAADELFTLIKPAEVINRGQWYDDFAPTTDEDVHYLLMEASQSVAESAL